MSKGVVTRGLIDNLFTGTDYLEAFADCKAPYWAKRAAHHLCESYAIKGLSDPAYIANLITSLAQKDCYCGNAGIEICDFCSGLRQA